MKKNLMSLLASSLVFCGGCSMVNPPVSEYSYLSKKKISFDYTLLVNPFKDSPKKIWTFYLERDPEDFGVPSEESMYIKLFGN